MTWLKELFVVCHDHHLNKMKEAGFSHSTHSGIFIFGAKIYMDGKRPHSQDKKRTRGILGFGYVGP